MVGVPTSSFLPTRVMLVEFVKDVSIIKALTRALGFGGIERMGKAELSFRFKSSAYLVVIGVHHKV